MLVPTPAIYTQTRSLISGCCYCCCCCCCCLYILAYFVLLDSSIWKSGQGHNLWLTTAKDENVDLWFCEEAFQWHQFGTGRSLLESKRACLAVSGDCGGWSLAHYSATYRAWPPTTAHQFQLQMSEHFWLVGVLQVWKEDSPL